MVALSPPLGQCFGMTPDAPERQGHGYDTVPVQLGVSAQRARWELGMGQCSGMTLTLMHGQW